MTQDHPDAIAYRRTADAFRARDLDLVKTLIAPEVVWHVPGEHHMAGTIDGREALLTWLAQLGNIGFLARRARRVRKRSACLRDQHDGRPP